MSRKEVENSILESLKREIKLENDFEDSLEILDEAYGSEVGRQMKDESAQLEANDAFNALSEREKGVERKKASRIDLGRALNERQRVNREKSLSSLNASQKFNQGFTDTFGEGKTDHQQAYWNARASQDLDIDAPKLSQMFGTNPTITRTRDLIRESSFLPTAIRNRLGSEEADYQARVDAGLGLSKDGFKRTGQVAGTLVSDINQDRLRNVWWLMNAPQAVTSVLQEAGLSKVAPDLYVADKVTDKDGYELTLEEKNYGELSDRGLISFDPEGNPVLKAGVNRVTATDISNDGSGKIALTKRRYRPGMVDALGLPSALAINAGVGLLNPFGGSNGYSAVFESDSDPTKTDNIVGEVAAKYILGRTGNLLNWDEFKKVRPDVSKDEYMRYKAFKYDKETDLNPLDGDFTLPVGILKGTSEGIHGPELQFLGRSMPLLTTLMPVAAAGIGTAAGAAWTPERFSDWKSERNELKKIKEDQLQVINKRNLSSELRDQQIRNISKKAKEAKEEIWRRKGSDYQNDYRSINRVRNGLVSGLASYAVAQGAGLLLENERRRRNQKENEQGFE